MNTQTLALEQATIRQYCKQLRTPTIGTQFEKMAEAAVKQKQSHIRYLEVLLAAEVEERERRGVERRLKEAQLPRVKTLEEFDFGGKVGSHLIIHYSVNKRQPSSVVSHEYLKLISQNHPN